MTTIDLDGGSEFDYAMNLMEVAMMRLGYDRADYYKVLSEATEIEEAVNNGEKVCGEWPTNG